MWSMDAPRNGVHAHAATPGRGIRGWATCAVLAGTVLLMAALGGCAAGDGSSAGATRSESARATGTGDGHDDRDGNEHDGDNGGDSVVTEIEFDELIDDPERLVGQQVSVTGNVFFVSECPPPGAANATCVLLGYLAGPEQHTLIAADVAKAIALAEGGHRLSCPEGSQPTPTCGDWVGEATYTVEGILQHQVLGGRETNLVQLDVSEKSAPQT